MKATSDREKRLWFFTVFVVLAIYVTLPLARTLADVLAGTGLGEGLFLVCCLLVLTGWITQGLRTQPTAPELGVGLGVVAAYLLVFARMSVPTERSHLIEYGVVASFILEALKERGSNGCPVRAPALTAFVVTSALGAIDEGIQAFLPSRVFEVTDILFNVLAAGMAVVTVQAMAWARARGIRKAKTPDCD